MDVAMNLTDDRLIELYRISKDMFYNILDKIQADLPEPTRSYCYSKSTQLLCVLRWLATGDFQRCVGQDYTVGVCQSGASKIISKVLPLLERHLCAQYIRWPETFQQRQAIKEGFFLKFGIPSTIGIIDGTQVELSKPRENEHLYVNRHGNHGINFKVDFSVRGFREVDSSGTTSLELVAAGLDISGGAREEFTSRDWLEAPPRSAAETVVIIGSSREEFTSRDWREAPPRSAAETVVIIGCSREEFTSRDWLEAPPRSAAETVVIIGSSREEFTSRDWREAPPRSAAETVDHTSVSREKIVS
uniref:DDE Tnp4 domain-containing protein n=2 Tax=Lutzomyia longipalpis TaxID=7200 RepID=A0A1B0CEC5_LUTLO